MLCYYQSLSKCIVTSFLLKYSGLILIVHSELWKELYILEMIYTYRGMDILYIIMLIVDNTAYINVLVFIGCHHYNTHIVFIHHVPEIVSGRLQTALCCNVLLFTIYYQPLWLLITLVAI